MRTRPSLATVIGLLALFVAVGGPAWAAGLIDGRSVKRSSITGEQVRDGSLGVTELTNATVAELLATPRRGVSQYALRAGAVTRDKLAPGAVGPLQIADGQLTGRDFRRRSIGRETFSRDLKVGHTELANNAAGLANVQDGAAGKDAISGKAVDSERVHDGALRLADLARFRGLARVTFGTLAGGACRSVNVRVTPAESTSPRPDLAATPLIVGRPEGFPDGLTLSARPTDRPRVLRFSACNRTVLPVTPGAQDIPYLALR